MQQQGWPRAMPQQPGMQPGMGNPMMGNMGNMGNMGGPPPANLRPGDWMCAKCNNHNFADKLACNRCKTPKLHTFFGGGYPPVPMGMGFPEVPNMRPGDWICRNCKNHNYADKAACNRCKVPKEVYIAATGMREGQPACGLGGVLWLKFSKYAGNGWR